MESESVIYLSKPKSGINSDLLLEKYEDFKYDLSCLICLGIVNDPRQCKICNQIFCEVCIEKTVTNYGCPSKCKNYHLQKLNLTTIKILNKLQFNCGNNCGDILTYEKYLDHITIECILARVGCKWCGILITKDMIKEHLESCESIELICPLCKMGIKKTNFENHHFSCPKNKIKCNKCKKQIILKVFSTHFKKCLGRFKHRSKKNLLVKDKRKKKIFKDFSSLLNYRNIDKIKLHDLDDRILLGHKRKRSQ
jgi:hypothetical protein